jgi:hypothetical protein
MSLKCWKGINNKIFTLYNLIIIISSFNSLTEASNLGMKLLQVACGENHTLAIIGGLKEENSDEI